MKRLFTIIAAAALSLAACACAQADGQNTAQALETNAAPGNAMGTFPGEEKMNYATDILTGAQQVEEYLKLVEGKRVCVLSNQSGMASATAHVLDTLLAHNVQVTCIMSPEHGFRGDADAGEHVSSSTDPKTGIPIRSLYEGKSGKPAKEVMDEFDVLVFDLQDVGVRFYTYYVTMVKMMAACAVEGKEFIVLDRPNPIGFYVDGPILNMEKYKSGVGSLPIPVVHGMTLGEIAYMANEKDWLQHGHKDAAGKKVKLNVVKCQNYTHAKLYRLPIKPSPNLGDMRAIYLYPSTCYFEGTPISLGRGTAKAFQMYGHPNMKGYSYSFTPRSIPGAKNPPLLDKECWGVDLTTSPSIEQINKDGINLEYIVDAYTNMNLGDHFFRNMFELEIGQAYVRKMIKEGKSAKEIEAEWVDDVEKFKEERKPYLLYPEN